LHLAISEQVRVRRRFGSRAFDETIHQLRLELEPAAATPSAITELLREINDVRVDAHTVDVAVDH